MIPLRIAEEMIMIHRKVAESAEDFLFSAERPENKMKHSLWEHS